MSSIVCSVKALCGGGELCYLSQVSTKTPIVFGPTGFSELMVLYASESRLRWDSLVRWLRGPVCLDHEFCGILAAVVQGLPSHPVLVQETFFLVWERLLSLLLSSLLLINPHALPSL